MKLADYLKERNLSMSAFGRQITLTPTAVKMLCDGVIWPSRQTAERIAKATKRCVTADDFMRLDEDGTKTEAAE